MISKDVYERIIDLADKVYHGMVDPLDIEVSELIEMIRKVDLNKLATDLMYLDINALYGLAMILEAQSEAIKRKTEGLYLDSMIVRLKIMALSVDKLADILRRVWRPPTELNIVLDKDLLDAKQYFDSIIKFKWTPPRSIEGYAPPQYIFVEEFISKHLNEIYQELIEYSRYNWVNYNNFISRGRKLFKAYILSFLISDGLVEMKIDRIKRTVLIRPLKKRVIYKNPISIPLVIRHG